ncbi:polysaccharide pyruvyl transferase family protein [Zunongwangia sp. SCSIO 43204]|uniref:polysaccharide pyruvyl transferase family protein n=1 Tax=Zunongwangia sp. SCSIO 43204 TaxID=2779359 RepID=UPI001CA96CDC|nr:polysaccharide pyruvyl transferase family protein [Zunongwangia sp. SCSIO 43204]UAB84437.1 polysaccharide pyruvyl transferase family protein [Zunongwangia sp. SCSIO 43204]|tara:strand:+ start:1186 stop:2079 length:894 start_codon:yes stop_codon:yes gene_type:complete
MKLIYYQKNKNFGDALNPFIFKKLIPNFFDDDPSSIFLGIGSILQFHFPEAHKKVVFSTGFAYGKLPEIDSSYDVICVRGPLTAKRIGIDPKLGITDGAALLKTFDFGEKEKKYKVSFMPHHQSDNNYDWKKVCREVGFNYIDPLSPFLEIIDAIKSSEVILAEAMHAAIVADTLRVPWIPIKMYPSINEFKWKDWTSSLDMQYTPNCLKAPYNLGATSEKIATRLSLEDGLLLKGLSKVHYKYSDMLKRNQFIDQFGDMCKAPQFLSDEKLLDDKVGQLQEKIEVFKRKYSSLYTL